VLYFPFREVTPISAKQFIFRIAFPFPGTVSDVGFTIHGDPRKKKRAAIPQPIITDGGLWPRRLEARSSVTLYFHRDQQKREIKKAYAVTDCGQVSYGNSPALRSMRSQLSS
jgi:hypothetical protein